jgi:HK97 family phage major capsid protein
MSEGHQPTQGMVEEAKKGLAWRKEFGRGGTLIGVARARDIINEKNLSLDTVKRMKSFFARHEVDKKAEGYRPGEKGYPSNGRIANALWGGDAGQTWANKIVEQANNEEKERMEAKDLATRHILEVEETENEYIVAFAKAKAEEVAEEPEMEMAEEERKATPEPLSFRVGEVERGWSYDKEKDDRRVRLAWSSQSPVEREFGYEVLGHSEDEIDLSFARSGRMPLLLDHDMRQQIGVVERVDLDSTAGIARATVRFGRSALAEEVFADVVDGIRSNVSVGYSVKGMTPTEEEIDGRGIFRVNSWYPQEISIVSVPADKGVGVGRSILPTKKEEKMEMEGVNVQVTNEPVPVPVIDEKSVRQQMLNEQNKIRSLAEGFGKSDFAERAIREGKPYLQFAEELSDEVRTNPHVVQPELTKKEKQNYSLVRAIQAAANNDWSNAGFEREISREIASRTGKEPRGFYIPDHGFQSRTLTGVTGSSGSGFGDKAVADNFLADRFIDALISTSIMGQVGATRFEGLVGDVQIPKFSANASVTFQTETGSVANGEPDFGQITMSPKTAANKIQISRQLLHQGLNGNIEQTLRDHMIRLFAAKLDNVAIKGGGSNEPTGVLGTTGIGDVESAGTSGNAALTYANCVDIWSEVAADNALLGSLYWVTHPRVVGKLMQTLVASSTDSRMIMMDTDSLLGYPVVQTTQAPSSSPYALLFGNFTDLYLGFFGALDVLVDPYGAAGNSTVNLYFYQMMDVAVARPESFSAAQDVTV